MEMRIDYTTADGTAYFLKSESVDIEDETKDWQPDQYHFYFNDVSKPAIIPDEENLKEIIITVSTIKNPPFSASL